MLPTDFTFSQTNLQDFTDCPALFDLRYCRHIVYPAVQSEPLETFEEHMQRGAAFHMLVQQHQVGVPPQVLTDSIDDDALLEWWQAYLTTPYAAAPTPTRAEITLSTPIAGFRLIAKLDLIAREDDGTLTIIDWKTAFKRPNRTFLASRLQTMVYPFVLVEAGRHLNDGQPIAPEQVRLMYWFPTHPKNPEIFAYDDEQHAGARARLERLIADIAARGDDDFRLTDDVRRCQFCEYRGLHLRGTHAGDWRDDDAAGDVLIDDGGVDFTLDQIAEVEF